MSGRECERADRAGGRRARPERDRQAARAGDPARFDRPGWFWWAIAVLIIAFAADVDYTSQRGALFWAGVALLAAGVPAVTGLLLRVVRGAPLRPGLVAPGSGPRLLAGDAALAAVVTGVTLAAKFSLEATGVPYPDTIAAAAGMAVLVAGGQMLTRYRIAFLVGRPGDRG